MAQIGLKNLYYATITEASAASTGVEIGDETYGTPALLAKAISADISIESNSATLYADDGADAIVKEFTQGTITLNINELGADKAVALLGVRKDKNNVVVSAAEDEAPYVAIGFQSKSTKGGDKYVWLYRVKFDIPAEAFKTRGDSVEFQTPTITGTFVRRNKKDEQGKHPFKADIVADSGTVVTGWFSSVYEPDYD